MRLLDIEDCRDLGDRNAGDEDMRGEPNGDGESLEEKRRSKGCSEVGR